MENRHRKGELRAIALKMKDSYLFTAELRSAGLPPYPSRLKRCILKEMEVSFMKGKGEEKMVSCRDVGVDCDFVARGKSEEEILKKTAEHARKEHGMKEIPFELKEKVRKAIHAV